MNIKNNKILIGSLLILLILANALTFTVWADGPDIPSPTKEFYINDFANVLNRSTEEQILNVGESINAKSDGGQIVFVSIDSLGDSTIEEYANALFNKWKIGKDDKGILFIISMEERESRIEVGYGYEGILTDIESYNLLKKFAEVSSREGLDKAVLTTYIDLSLVVMGDKDSVQYPEYNNGNKASRSDGEKVIAFILENPILVVIIVVLIILDLIFTRGRITWMLIRIIASSARRGGGGGRNSGGGGRSGGGGASSRF